MVNKQRADCMTKRIPTYGWVSMVAEDGDDYTTKSEDNLVAVNKAAE